MEPSLEEASLEELMNRYQAADADAAAQLVEKLSPNLLRFFLMQQSMRAEADDLLQETWLRIHRVRHTFRSGSPILPWVFAIARHVRVDAYRKRRRIEQNENAVDVLPEQISRTALGQGSTLDFQALMAKLPESQREVLILLKVNGLSLEEVARATSSTVGAIKQKASRAYATLRASIQQESMDKNGKQKL